MFVNIPWKGVFPLRDDQKSRIEYDDKGPFLRVRNIHTGYLNKCRVIQKKAVKSPKKESPPKKEGGSVYGVIRRTGPDYVAIVVDRVGDLERGKGLEEELFRLGKRHLKEKGKKWNVRVPRAWDLPIGGGKELGPHISLDFDEHIGDVGKRVKLRIIGIESWREDSRWVALFLDGPFVDKTDWKLHMSIAQEPL